MTLPTTPHQIVCVYCGRDFRKVPVNTATSSTWLGLFEAVHFSMPEFDFNDVARVLKCWLMPDDMLPEVASIALGVYHKRHHIGLPELHNMRDVMHQSYEPWLGHTGQCRIFVYLSHPDYPFMESRPHADNALHAYCYHSTVEETEEMYAQVAQFYGQRTDAYKGLDISMWTTPPTVEGPVPSEEFDTQYFTNYRVIYDLDIDIRGMRRRK
jgi:hypothetical protein